MCYKHKKAPAKAVCKVEGQYICEGCYKLKKHSEEHQDHPLDGLEAHIEEELAKLRETSRGLEVLHDKLLGNSRRLYDTLREESQKQIRVKASLGLKAAPLKDAGRKIVESLNPLAADETELIEYAHDMQGDMEKYDEYMSAYSADLDAVMQAKELKEKYKFLCEAQERLSQDETKKDLKETTEMLEQMLVHQNALLSSASKVSDTFAHKAQAVETEIHRFFQALVSLDINISAEPIEPVVLPVKKLDSPPADTIVHISNSVLYTFDVKTGKADRTAIQSKIPGSPSCAKLGESVFLAGGRGCEASVCSETFEILLQKNMFVAEPRAPMNCPRADHTLLPLASGQIISIGGEDQHYVIPRCEIYDIQKNSWSDLKSLNIPRKFAAACAFPIANPTKVYVFGGKCRKEGGILGSIEMLSLPAADGSWKLLEAPRMEPNHSVCAYAGEEYVYVFGGAKRSDKGFAFSEDQPAQLASKDSMEEKRKICFWNSSIFSDSSKAWAISAGREIVEFSGMTLRMQVGAKLSFVAQPPKVEEQK